MLNRRAWQVVSVSLRDMERHGETRITFARSVVTLLVGLRGGGGVCHVELEGDV